MRRQAACIYVVIAQALIPIHTATWDMGMAITILDLTDFIQVFMVTVMVDMSHQGSQAGLSLAAVSGTREYVLEVNE
jgi:hypothetical protein